MTKRRRHKIKIQTGINYDSYSTHLPMQFLAIDLAPADVEVFP